MSETLFEDDSEPITDALQDLAAFTFGDADVDRRDAAGYTHRIVQVSNRDVIRPAETALAAIGTQREQAEAEAADLRDHVRRACAPVREWLQGLKTTTYDEERDSTPVPARTVDPGPVLRRRFTEPLQDVDLTTLHQAWGEYHSTPRRSKYEGLNNQAQGGGCVAGVAFLLLLIASAFSDGIGFFKGMYLLGIVGGLAFVAQSVFARQEHKATLRSAYDAAQRLTELALERLEQSAARLVSQIEAHLSASRKQLIEKERLLRERYAAQIRHLDVIFEKSSAAADLFGREFVDATWGLWSPASNPIRFLRLGSFTAPTAPLDHRLQAPKDLPSIPALVPFAPGKGLCFIGSGNSKGEMIAAVQSLALRLVAGLPPGKLRFTFIDPVGLGQNVAPLLSLGDKIEELIGGRAWSEPTHIEQRLGELTQHMETVIQKYLRTEHKTIESYNANAGQVIEAYRIVVICDFPTNFTEAAARRLISIAQNGPRCGVYPIVVVDSNKPMPYGVSLEALTTHLTCIQIANDQPEFIDPDFAPWHLQLDSAPPAELAKQITSVHGELAEGGMRVSVPFSDLVSAAGLSEAVWSESRTTIDDVSVPLGQSGARKYHDLVFGKGTAHHALVVGQTGSGKSNLLHVLITTLALKYSPDELVMYLIDFKQGVEFKLYAEASLPHARVIAVQSEREFGLSVLRGLHTEMDRRGDMFRETGTPNLADWRKKSGKRLPRILLLVDEFRVFFAEDDAIANETRMILDRLVSQGRGFGIHVVLASQTLAGSYSLPRAISDQMAVRIVLQCTEADSRLALAEDNPEARLLSRPGEAIYNDQRGLIEGNHRFQVADMGNDETREAIVRTHLTPRLDHWKGTRESPTIFEGHLPARAESSRQLSEVIHSAAWPAAAKFADVWLGEPISMRAPTSVRFLRQGGANLLLVLRDEIQALTLLQMTILALAAQLPPESAAFHIVDVSSADGPLAGSLESLATGLRRHRCEVVSRRGLAPKVETLAKEVTRRLRAESSERGSVFLILAGLHRMHDLRESDGSSVWGDQAPPDLRAAFATMVREGPELGVHTIAWADSPLAASRVLDRRMLADFGRRIVGSMSEQDSLTLIDDPLAGRINRPHRLIRYDEDRPGDLETFRPYAVSGLDWVTESAAKIAARSGPPAKGPESQKEAFS